MKDKAHYINAYGYWILSLSVFVALIVVLLIFDSNIQKKVVTQPEPDPEMQQQLALLNEALEKNPGDYGLNIDMANALFDIQKYRGAIGFYRRALLSEPSNIAPQIDLAICYYNLQLVDSALVELKKALEIDPGHIKGLFNMGIMYYNSNQIELARRYWLKLINLHGETPEAQKALEILNGLTS